MRSPNAPPVRSVRRFVGAHDIVILTLVVALATLVLRNHVFAGQPTAQAACNVVFGLDAAAYASARLHDPSRQVTGGVYLVVIGVGLAAAIVWTTRLF